MTRAELEAHPDLVTHLDPDAARRCPVLIVYARDPEATWRCHQPARWQVKGHPAKCGQHAARTLRRLLVQAEATEGGGS